MNIVRLLKLANDLDNAGLTKEADIVESNRFNSSRRDG